VLDDGLILQVWHKQLIGVYHVLQICREFERFGKPMGVKVGNFFGGMDIKAHKDMLKDEDKCPDIVVGTPGRIKQVSLLGEVA